MKNLSTKAKLILGFGVIILINIAFGLYAIRAVSTINGRVIEANDWTVAISQLGELTASTASVRRFDFRYFIQTKPEDRQLTLQQWNEGVKKAEEIIGVYRHDVETLPFDTEEQRQADRAAITAVNDAWNAYLPLAAKIRQEIDAGRSGEALQILEGASMSAFEAVEKAVASLIRFNEENCAEVAAMGDDIYRSTSRTIVGILIAVSIISVLVPTLLVQGIKRSIDELLRVSKALAEGNLRVASGIDSGDEFGLLSRQYNATISSIKSLISNIQESAGSLSGAADDFREGASQTSAGTEIIARGIEDVSQQSNAQRTEIDAITARINDMSQNIVNLTAVLDDIARGAAESVQISQDGSESMQKAVAQMNVIESVVSLSSDVVGKLGERSQEIGRIVETIASIASQTNLLALNAAIEAARAGEQGRGFAVVAEEVKKLAGESHSAAEEIGRLIASIQEETAKAIEAMGTGKEEAQRGSSAVSDGGRAFGDLSQVSVKSSEAIQGITSEMHGMAMEASGIVQAVSSVAESGREIAHETETMAAATQQQTASMTEVSDASENLARIATEMLATAQRFSV